MGLLHPFVSKKAKVLGDIFVTGGRYEDENTKILTWSGETRMYCHGDMVLKKTPDTLYVFAPSLFNRLRFFKGITMRMNAVIRKCLAVGYTVAKAGSAFWILDPLRISPTPPLASLAYDYTRTITDPGDHCWIQLHPGVSINLVAAKMGHIHVRELK